MQPAFVPAIQVVESHYDKCRQQHVHPAGHGSPVYFKVGQGQQGRQQGDGFVVAMGEETERGSDHCRSSQGRRQTGGEFRHVAAEGRKQSNKPVKQRGLESDFVTVVDGQYPVAVLYHGVGYNGLARFAARIEWGEA